jgi:hypothetical protein
MDENPYQSPVGNPEPIQRPKVHVWHRLAIVPLFGASIFFAYVGYAFTVIPIFPIPYVCALLIAWCIWIAYRLNR